MGQYISTLPNQPLPLLRNQPLTLLRNCPTSTTVSMRYTTRIGRCITPPLGRSSMVDISTVGIVPEPKRSALETSRRELSEDVSFGIGTLLVVEQSSFEKPPEGCDIHLLRRKRYPYPFWAFVHSGGPPAAACCESTTNTRRSTPQEHKRSAKKKDSIYLDLCVSSLVDSMCVSFKLNHSFYSSTSTTPSARAVSSSYA